MTFGARLHAAIAERGPFCVGIDPHGALLRGRVTPDTALVGVGGITTERDAIERVEAGADLVQAYTAFIYEGPAWPSRLAAATA